MRICRARQPDTGHNGIAIYLSDDEANTMIDYLTYVDDELMADELISRMIEVLDGEG